MVCFPKQDDVLQTPSQEAQDGKASGKDAIHSRLLREAQHRFDFLVESVLQQLSIQGWQALATHLLLPSGVPAIQLSQQVGIIQLTLLAVLHALERLFLHQTSVANLHCHI